MNQIESQHSFRLLIESEFFARRTRNPRYSLRKFATDLEIPPGRLSEIMRGKRNVTPNLAEKISDTLALPRSDRAAISAAKRDCSLWERNKTVLSDDLFALIGDWQHYAVLNLMETRDFSADVRWIANRLKITPINVELVLSRLERLGFVQRLGKKLFRLKRNLSTTTDIPSVAIRRANRQYLEMAGLALDEVGVKLRDITSMVLAVNTSKLPLAKKKIANFQREMMALLEQGSRDEVYNLCISLYPITRSK